MSTDAPIVILHSMFGPGITRKAAMEALPGSWPEQDIAWVEIQPDYRRLDEYGHDYDWDAAAAVQEQQFRERLEPLLKAAPDRPVAYFGLAPVPMAFHLGTLVTEGYEIWVYQRHHHRQQRRWCTDESTQQSSLVTPLADLGEDKSAAGDLILRVSTSHQVASQDSREALEGRAAVIRDFDLRVRDLDEDRLTSQEDLEAFCRAFDRLLDDLGSRYAAARWVHLFAAVPCGVAFRMGTYYSNFNVRKPVQTYKFQPNREPRYAPALAIGRVDRAEILLLTADPRGWTPTSGLSEVKAIGDVFEPVRTRVKVTTQCGLRASELHRRLDGHARILHFAGHGTGTTGDADDTREISCPEVHEPGTMLLLGPEGHMIGVRHDDLLDIVRRGKPIGLRCVVLSACFTDELARRLVEEAGVRHAIGFAGAIDDAAAHEFSVAFYQALRRHGIVEDAVAEGKRAIEFAGREGREQVRYYPLSGRDRVPLIY